ncbi:MAG: carbohydrate kinase family protein [Chloroflexota bacterium]
MTAAERVTVLGDALLDVLARPAAPLMAAGDVTATVSLRPGGQGANVGVRLARRGVSVRLLSALANDTAGQMLRGILAGEGIQLAEIPVEASGSVVVLIDAAGERTMLSQRAPFAHLVGGELLAPPASWIVVSGYLLLEPDAGGLVRLLAAATTPIAILGCALPDTGRAATWGARVRDAGASLVILNAAEARALLEIGRGAPTGTEATLAPALATLLGALVVVTGPMGAAAAEPGGQDTRVEPASGAGPIVDTTGAGDAFSAAVIASLARGEQLAAALTAGVTLAAAVARVEGAQTHAGSELHGTLDE